MDPLPPNDPNSNNNLPNSGAKEDPYDGRQRRRGGRGGESDNGEMDVVGDLRDQGFVMVMFLMGVASWLLRDQCVC